MPHRFRRSVAVADHREPDRPQRSSMLSFVPRRNLRRALFLLLALMGVLSLKMSDGCNLLKVLEVVAPPAQPDRAAGSGVMHLRVQRPDPRE